MATRTNYANILVNIGKKRVKTHGLLVLVS